MVQVNLVRGLGYGNKPRGVNGNFNPNGGRGVMYNSDQGRARGPKRNDQCQFCLKIGHVAS